jgi:hypothetical protein
LKLTPKTKKMKLLAILLFLLPLCVVILGAGCEEDEEIVELSEKGFLKFSDFGCENIVWNFKAGNSNSYYTVNSQQELSNYINSDCNPQIDFNKYFVIIGSKSFPTGVSLFDEKVEENNKEIVYTITFLTDDTFVASGAKYHAVIKKPSGKKEINVVEIVKDHI